MRPQLNPVQPDESLGRTRSNGFGEIGAEDTRSNERLMRRRRRGRNETSLFPRRADWTRRRRRSLGRLTTSGVATSVTLTLDRSLPAADHRIDRRKTTNWFPSTPPPPPPPSLPPGNVVASQL